MESFDCPGKQFIQLIVLALFSVVWGDGAVFACAESLIETTVYDLGISDDVKPRLDFSSTVSYTGAVVAVTTRSHVKLFDFSNTTPRLRDNFPLASYVQDQTAGNPYVSSVDQNFIVFDASQGTCGGVFRPEGSGCAWSGSTDHPTGQGFRMINSYDPTHNTILVLRNGSVERIQLSKTTSANSLFNITGQSVEGEFDPSLFDKIAIASYGAESGRLVLETVENFGPTTSPRYLHLIEVGANGPPRYIRDIKFDPNAIDGGGDTWKQYRPTKGTDLLRSNSLTLSASFVFPDANLIALVALEVVHGGQNGQVSQVQLGGWGTQPSLKGIIGHLQMQSLSDGTLLGATTFNGENEAPSSASISPDGTMIAMGTNGGSVFFYDNANLRPFAKASLPHSTVTSMGWTERNTLLATLLGGTIVEIPIVRKTKAH